jgi:hypothetical protein
VTIKILFDFLFLSGVISGFLKQINMATISSSLIMTARCTVPRYSIPVGYPMLSHSALVTMGVPGSDRQRPIYEQISTVTSFSGEVYREPIKKAGPFSGPAFWIDAFLSLLHCIL